MEISVIMPVNLDNYTTAAKNPEQKFIRAVKSFINQSFNDAELMIVSDGCDKAKFIYYENFDFCKNIQFKIIEKQADYGGFVRQTGINMAKGNIICYLDHDDMFGKDHLAIINKNFNTDKYEWIYYNDYLINRADSKIMGKPRNVFPAFSHIGTSSIAHKRSTNVLWGDNYGHDWRMISKYLLPLPGIKITTPQYYVCHVPGFIDV